MFFGIDINTVIIDLLPILVALGAYLYQLLVQRLPAEQRQCLEQFATLAAKKIEQVYPDAGSVNKKQLATEVVLDLFKAFKLPTPDNRAIDTAIESAVLAINQAQTSNGQKSSSIVAATTTMASVTAEEPGA
jgi:hypothetical protein